MAKMKKKQQNEKLYCPYCGGLAVLRPAEYVYGERNLNPICMFAVVTHPVILILESIKRVCGLWELWQMGIFAINGLKHTGR